MAISTRVCRRSSPTATTSPAYARWSTSVAATEPAGRDPAAPRAPARRAVRAARRDRARSPGAGRRSGSAVTSWAATSLTRCPREATRTCCRTSFTTGTTNAPRDPAQLPDAMNPGGKLLLVEKVIPAEGEPHPAKITDVTMLALTGGMERTEAEYADLLDRAGLPPHPRLPTPSPVSVIEAVPTARSSATHHQHHPSRPLADPSTLAPEVLCRTPRPVGPASRGTPAHTGGEPGCSGDGYRRRVLPIVKSSPWP